MPIEIRMPALSPTMTEGNLTRWLKKEGDEVHSGDVIAEIETDKATMEYEAVEDAGALEKFAAAPSGDGQHTAAPAMPPSGVNPKTEAPPAPAAQPAPA